MIILHDARLPEEYEEALRKKMPEAYFLPVPASPGVYDSIASHPDIYFCQLDDRMLIHSPSVPRDVLEVLAEGGFELVPGQSPPGGAYPATARYNAVRSGDFFLHNLQYTDPVVLTYVEKLGLRAIDVPQSYARCSLFPVSSSSAITADEGIAHSLRFSGIEVLLIRPGSITLPGQEYGFIGGAGGITPDGTVIFLGNVSLHPDGDRMIDFLTEREIPYTTLAGLPLYDAGSLIIL